MPHPQPYIQITRRSTTFTAHSFKISTDPTDSPTTKKGLNHLNRSSTQGKSATLWPFLFFKLKPWRRYWTFSTVREAFGCCCCRVDSPKYLCLNIKINISEKLIKALRLLLCERVWREWQLEHNFTIHCHEQCSTLSRHSEPNDNGFYAQTSMLPPTRNPLKHKHTCFIISPNIKAGAAYGSRTVNLQHASLPNIPASHPRHASIIVSAPREW